MDRRQRKTREAVFAAFISLLSEKNYSKITVGEIIDRADVGRATFYSHFETKDYLLKELCEDLFCHLLDSVNKEKSDHKHIFECDNSDSVFLHLFRHIKSNDNNLLVLLSGCNTDLFMLYFKSNLKEFVKNNLFMFENDKSKKLPESFLVNHIASSFIETVKWWIDNGMNESVEKICEYFFSCSLNFINILFIIR